MGKSFVWLSLVVLVSLGFRLGGRTADEDAKQETDCKSLYASHDWFRLREAIGSANAPALYKGAVAAAFNQPEEALADLRPLLNSPDDSQAAEDADDWISYLFVRNGQYHRAAAEMDEGAPLLDLLRTLPDQSVASYAPSSFACRLAQHHLYIPLTVNGADAEFFLDSDANFSFVSESEAAQLGLTVRDSALKVHGATGIATNFRIAVAEKLRIGNLELNNVAFMVMPDHEAVFAQSDGRRQGAIGLPVLLAFETLHYEKGRLEIAPATKQISTPEQNLCFDGLDLVTRARMGEQNLPFVLDTGAAQSQFWPPLARNLPPDDTGLKSKFIAERSFGGASTLRAKMLPNPLLSWGGTQLRLGSIPVLLDPTTPNSERYYGRLGLDAWLGVQELTIDFKTLTVRTR